MTARRVTFYVDRDPMPWSAADADGAGLPGGAELAVVEVAGGLAALGHRVTVHANVRAAETHAGVAYLPRDALDRTATIDALVCTRAFELLDDPPRAHTTLLWVHSPDAGDALTPARAERVDRVLALSAWHERQLRDRHPFVAERVAQVRNGVDAERFDLGRAREPRALCTSQPERGVDVVLELWPAVRARVPDAELAHCHAPVYDHLAGRPSVADHRRRVAELSDQPGVRALGPLPPAALADLMSASRVWVHPSWSTPAGRAFEETSCIAAMEAQAAGLWAVASPWGALPETIRCGAAIDAADAPGERWRRAIVDEIVRGLTDPATRRRAESEAPAAVADLGWDGVAEQMAALIEEGRP